MTIGSTYIPGSGTTFRVWAPNRQSVEVHIVSPENRRISMDNDEEGYWHATDTRVEPGAQYFYTLDHRVDRPDPASRLQPRGVHGPSEVIRPHDAVIEDDGFQPPTLADLILYELHVGTFTPAGTFSAAAAHLDYLKDLGINAVELMPVAHFPGQRNWGYDGVYPFAVHTAYGGPAGLAGFVETAHAKGVAVYLDVVYNHLGPEGNYLRDFGPYFTDFYSTPWGEALNFDGPYSDHVRRYVIENLRFWLEDFKVDGLRLDAVHALFDASAVPILSELSAEAERVSIRSGRRRILIAESLQNDSRVITPRDRGGAGIQAEWLDDLHHSLHAYVTGERDRYYVDFGELEHIRKAFAEAYVLARTYSHYYKRTFGNSAADRLPRQFVVYTQNHDQIGNRARGDRLAASADLETLKLLASSVLLGPYTPMLFMGEEYGETAPFEYFVSHSDPDLIHAVRTGRKEGFSEFLQKDETVPDPQSAEAFERSKIDLGKASASPRNACLFRLHRELIRLRRYVAALPPDEPTIRAVLGPPEDLPADFEYDAVPLRARLSVESEDDVIAIARATSEGLIVTLLNFASQVRQAHFERNDAFFQVLFDSSDNRWSGPGMKNGLHVQPAEPIWLNPRSAILLQEQQ
ncbi:MAG: malto-oligosyltrehalose trehalohydrolase [Spirochaetales bacterium]